VTDPQLVQYYKERAKSYDSLYTREDRQDALREASEILKSIFTGKEVLEIACGTGYWTEQIAKTAKSILATDINDTMLDIARTRQYGPAPVTFGIRDMFAPVMKQHESLFGGYWWSHILRQDVGKFLNHVNKNVVSGGTVVFTDNLYVEGSNLPVTRTDAFGNTYQARTLDDGSEHEVLKNFVTEESILNALSGKARDIRFTALKYYWILEYKTL
jgi:SAM-dependent methyltransferase